MNTYKVRNDKGDTFEVDAEKIGDAEKDGYLPIVSNGDQEHRVASADLHKAEADGYKPLGSKGFLQGASDFIDAASENMTDMLPGKGIITKAATLVPAATEYVYDRVADDGKPRSFSDTYDENLKEGMDYQDKRRNASTAGKIVGTAAGLVTGVKLPGVGNSPLTRIAGNAALSAVDEGTKGEDLIDTKRGGQAGLISGGLTAALESIPVVGKAAGWVGKKIGSGGFGVAEEATDRYLANPEKMRGVIEEGSDGLRNIKDRVDEAYFNKVQKVRENAADGLIEAKEAKREADRLQKEYFAELKNLKPHESLTDEVITGVRNENDKLSRLSGEAYDTLDGLEFDRGTVLDKIQSIKGSLLVDGKKPTIGDAAPAWGVLERLERAVQSNEKPDINSLMNQAENVPGIAGKDLKKLIQQLDQESSAAYTTYGSRGAAKYIKGVRDEIDPILKGHKPYEDAMVPTAEQTRLVSQLTDVFGDPEKARRTLLLSADPEKGSAIRNLIKKLDANNGTNISAGLDEYLNAQKILRDPETNLATKRMMSGPTDRGLSKAQQAAKEAGNLRSQFNRVAPGSSEGTIEKVGRDRNIEGEKQLRALVGDSGLEDVKDYSLAKDFVTDKTRGARRTAAGAIAGGAVGSLLGPAGTAIGTTLGGAAGATVDKYGGKIWQAVLDGTIKAGPYRKILEDAEKRGLAAVATTHIFLMEKYPDYRKRVEEAK